VQGLTWETRNDAGAFFSQSRPLFRGNREVQRVADQRMTQGGHMNPNLMGSARFQPAFDQ